MLRLRRQCMPRYQLRQLGTHRRTFSWLLLYTLICYVVFKNEYTDITLLTNVVIVVVTLEAGCRAANFDCRAQNYISLRVRTHPSI